MARSDSMALQMRSWLLVVLVTLIARPAYSAGDASDKWELHDFPHPFNLAADYLRKGGLEVLPDAQNIYAPVKLVLSPYHRGLHPIRAAMAVTARSCIDYPQRKSSSSS